MNRKIVSTCVLVALAFMSEALTAEKEKTIAEFRAFAINMQGGPMTNAGVVEIGLWGWSTEANRDMLIATLKEKGSDALLEALTSHPPLGYIRMPNTLGWSIYYARQTELPDGSKKIVMATNRKLLTARSLARRARPNTTSRSSRSTSRRAPWRRARASWPPPPRSRSTTRPTRSRSRTTRRCRSSSRTFPWKVPK